MLHVLGGVLLGASVSKGSARDAAVLKGLVSLCKINGMLAQEFWQ